MILNYVHWNPDPEIFNLFGISIRYYSLLFLGGIVICIYLLKSIFRNEGIAAVKLEKLTTYGIIGILAGARIGHCLFYEPEYYLSHLHEIILPIKFLEGGGFKFTGFQGLASHGGALGLIIAIVLFCRKYKESVINIIDLIAVVTGVGAAFIRLANFMNSEIVGMPTDKPWAVIFERVDNIPRHPAQLYEAISYLIIFAITYTLYKTNRKHLKQGAFFGITISLIFIARFFIEFIKEHQVAFEDKMALDMGQILSIPYIVVGIGFFIYGVRKSREKSS